MARNIFNVVTLLVLAGTLAAQPGSNLQSYFSPLDTALIGTTYFSRINHSGFVRIAAADSATHLPLNNAIVDIDEPPVYLHKGDAERGLWLRRAKYRIAVHVNGYTGAIFDSVLFAPDSVSEMVAFLSVGGGTMYHRPGMGPLRIASRPLAGVPVGRINVRVVDAELTRPIPGAVVIYEKTGEQCFADDSGSGSLMAQCPGQGLTLRVSHKAYGDVSVPFDKRYDASVKNITVYLLRRQFVSRYPRDGSRQEIRFLITKELWVANSSPGYEYPLDAYVVRPDVGAPFGPSVSWSRQECFPFRLTRHFQSSSAWVTFSNYLAGGNSNFAIVDSMATTVNTNTRDGGFRLTIQVLPPQP